MTNGSEARTRATGGWRRGRRWLAIGAIGAGATLGGALIGDGAIASGSNGASTAASGGAGGGEEAAGAPGLPPELGAFQRCMQDHGAVVPARAPSNELGGGTRLVLRAIGATREDCSAKLAARPDDAVLQQRMDRHRQCMSEHGIELPAPTRGDSGVSIRVDPATADSPEFQAAREQCDPILFGSG
jgi:hypothetical protein